MLLCQATPCVRTNKPSGDVGSNEVDERVKSSDEELKKPNSASNDATTARNRQLSRAMSAADAVVPR